MIPDPTTSPIVTQSPSVPLCIPQKPFLTRLGHALMHYVWGAFAAGWNGAMTAVHGYIAISVGSSLDPDNITPPSMHTLFFFFAVRFVIDSVGYFKANPLPENLDLPVPPNVPEITTAPVKKSGTQPPFAATPTA